MPKIVLLSQLRRPIGVAARNCGVAVSAVALTLASNSLARAADVAAKPTEPAPTLCDGQPSISGSVPVLGDWKKALCERGFNLQVNYIGDVFGNPTGGVKQGARYEQRIELGLDGNMEQIAGIKGLTFHVNSYAIAGQSLSTFNLLNYSAITYIAAHPAWLLFEAWAEYKFLDDRLSIRVGQLAADSDFFISEMGQLYTNSTYGFPNLFADDLPGGGPAYPFATPGVRVKVYAGDWNFIGAVFNGDPTGAGFTGQNYQRDPSGTDFRLKDPPLVIGEAQLAYNQDKDSTGLAGKLKFGGWYHFGAFDDYHFGFDGLSLADPDSDGEARTHQGNFSLYGVIDQMLWRLPGGDDPKKGIGAFARVTAAPEDRNLMNFYADGGINFMGLWKGDAQFGDRSSDQFGVSVSYSELSPPVHALDLDTAFFAGQPLPARNYELLLEATYQAQIMPGWTVQPDFEYVFHPGGGAVNPLNPASGRIPDAAVFGLRTNIQF